MAPGAAALEQVASLGPFFAVTVNDSSPRARWRPLSDLLDDPKVLGKRIATTRAALATRAGVDLSSVDPKVAASTVQLALSSRLLSPAVAAAVWMHRLPLLTPSTMWWRPGDADPLRLAVPASLGAHHCSDVAELVDALGTLLREVVSPLVEATRAVVAVSRLVLWGNVASALHTAITLSVRAQPSRKGTGTQLLAGMLARSPLAGTSAPTLHFRRNSCCLRYRLPGAQLCGDCVLLADSR